MAAVITSKCEGVCAMECVRVCPMDCIHGPLTPAEVKAGGSLQGVQMFVDPEVCIDCAACIAVCPEQAIYLEDDLPPEHSDALERNERFFAMP